MFQNDLMADTHFSEITSAFKGKFIKQPNPTHYLKHIPNSACGE